jgi:tetratricopeptide (TPR) repeat protein
LYSFVYSLSDQLDIGADIPVATLPLRILKGILHQMLDHSVSDLRTQEAVLAEVAKAAQLAIDGAGDNAVEESLWRGIQSGLSTNVQYMFVVDGIDQIKGGDTNAIACLNRFCEILSAQNAGSKMIAFTRPLSLKVNSKGVQQFTIESSQTKMDLAAYVTKMLASGASFDTHKGNQLQAAVSAIASRAQGSFSWAEMAVAYAKHQKTLSLAVTAVQSLPQSMPELLDFHSKSLDFSQQGTINIVSWLAAAERPLLVEEVEELLNVNPNGPSYSSNKITDSHDILNALSPLVMTRDGVVSFAHTCIRDHVIKQAKSTSGNSQLSIKDGHHDLLTRCLASVQLSVDEDVDVSMDKLGIEERNHLFDKYVVLEYTARYWLSHLLSSPLVTDDGEFQFTSSFTKLMPATVLFARLELTCRESQFTRSSVVELYRLASDIRRLVLGDKSMALLQSLILSARVSRLAHASHADETCYESWKLSQELLGQSHPITLACSEMMTQSFSERGTMTSQQEDIMKYLILTDSEITGVEFNQRLKYLGMLVGMYKSRGDNKSALFISKHFYQQILQKYGTNSRQSSETADFLTGHFSTTGTDEMSRDIARTKYDNMVRTMEVTDDRRIKYSLYMAKMYEEQGDIVHAQAVLSSLWAGLNSRDIDSVDMMDKKSNVALAYYQFLRRQGRNDEAEVVIRELVAGLEVTGIHSPEMMEHVHLLRAETRDMLMFNLDRSLAVLMWRYYKENHQEYSPEGTALALSIAQSMANSVNINDASSLSVRDRKLLVELLDSISASEENMTVTTLIMCHNLSSIYVREGDWAQAIECTMAVLQHIWPTVEQPESHQKFSHDLAPPAADLALILAYCHFRRLHLEQATVVYENALGSLISSDRVPVPSVLAVAKAVVEFHETSYQFPKALSLLHTVTNFLAARLGETHKHTIDNMYLEAALATRLEMHSEAKSIYQRIYKATSQEKSIAPEGIEAAVALIGIYEKGMEWSSALHVYRSLWPTLVVEDNKEQERTYDQRLIDRMLEKTYMGYISILAAKKGSDFSEQYKVASEYVMTCHHVHGPTSQKTLNATLLFAELCESNDAYIDRAITLYKTPLEINEWVETSEASKPLEQMTAPLPITLKHKLAQLFVRKHDSTSEARSLYTEEYQLAKKTQGYFSTTTLSWLRELALAHSRQGTTTSVQQGNAILHTHSTDVLHAGGEPDMIGDWARRIASIYLECGYIEGGNNFLDELRQRVVYSPEASTMALPERRDAIFVAAFEEVFGRRASYDQIMKEMSTEMKTHQTFSKNLSGHDFVPTLISGHLLYTLQIDQKRVRPANDTKNKLYEYFCTNLSATSVADKEVVQQFYQICLREVHNENYNMNILTTTTNLVRDLCNASRFQEATILTGVLHSFMHLTDGLNSHQSIKIATQLCLYLSGHKATKCADEQTHKNMSIKAKLLLQEIMSTSKSLGIEMIDLPFNDLNDIITLLGEHDMFPELETILTQLWTSRIVQRTWTPDVVVWIGRRLVETRFCRGNVDSAIQLCRDICYNLRQVWGSCDPVTLEMTKLLSALFTASEDHQSAATLHEGVLYDLLGDSEAKGHARAADTVSQHMELLRRAQGRLGGQSSGRASSHAELFQALADRFGVQEGVGEENGEEFGVWSKPRRFSIDVEDMEEEGQAHRNHLRESSGVGGPRRISVQAL